MGKSSINGPFQQLYQVPTPPPGNWSRNPFFSFFRVWGGGGYSSPVNLLTSCMLRELRGLNGLYIYNIDNITQRTSHLDRQIDIYIYKKMCIHMHLFSLLYTYKCTYILVYIHAHRYISHLRTHTHAHTHRYISHVYLYIQSTVSIYMCTYVQTT